MSIQSILKQFKGPFSFTLFLVLAEAVLSILYPLFIGLAIDDAIQQNYKGAIYLGGLGMLSLLVGAGRRFYDSRFYARVFQDMGGRVVQQEQLNHSQRTARLNMLREMVEFLENSVPGIVSSLIGLLGTLIIVANLNSKIFLACLATLFIVLLIYRLSRNKTIRYNEGYNNEMERQVAILDEVRPKVVSTHLRDLMKWNIRLSDLEMINFSLVWIIMILLLVLSIGWSVAEGVVQYGAVFALVMYVFQYIESLITLPFFYQQWLRLAEISTRLSVIGQGIDAD